MKNKNRVTKINKVIIQVQGGASFSQAIQESVLTAFNNMFIATFEFNGKVYEVNPEDIIRIIEENGKTSLEHQTNK